jgi:hypothetical protein
VLGCEALHRLGASRSALAAAGNAVGSDARRCAPPRSSAVIAAGTVSLDGRRYRLYPEVLDARPDLPSPLTAADGTELVLAVLQNGKYGIVPATLREPDGQCRADGRDFPTLEATGLHSEVELERTRVITGRTAEIADLARPGPVDRRLPRGGRGGHRRRRTTTGPPSRPTHPRSRAAAVSHLEDDAPTSTWAAGTCRPTAETSRRW